MKNSFWITLITVGLLSTSTICLSAAETPLILRVGVAPVSPPMIYKEGGKIVGLEADFARALSKDLGREVKFVELPWVELIDALTSDKIDIIMSSMSITRARMVRIAFSDPYMRIGQMALVRADERGRYGFLMDSLAGRKIGLRAGTTGDLMVQQEFPLAKRKYYKTDEDAAVALSKEKIDLFIDDSTMIWYLAGAYEAKGLVPASLVFTEESLAWGMKRSDTDLQQSVNAFLKKVRANGEAERLLHQWIPRFQ
jgi:polar amino acid transport system substrate-binding protein